MAEHSRMTPETLTVLRKQFPPEQIGKLPRKGITLDYVGHADVTSRLLEADPEWSWEPLARDVDPQVYASVYGSLDVMQVIIANCPPRFDLDHEGNPVGLWIRLTIGGVTRLGYGSCPSTQNDAIKVLIGDALRNAAMRFGVALDLWCRGDRADPTMENPSGPAAKVNRHTASRRDSEAPLRSTPSKPPAKSVEKVTETPESIAGQAAKAATLEELRDVWKRATAAGVLQKEVITTDGEKLTVQDYLYRMSDALSLPKSSPSGAEDTGRGDHQ